MAFKIGTAARDGACNGIVDLIDGGSGAGFIRIYTGAAPTNVADANSGTLLATLTFSDPAFGASSTGVATASAITNDSSADASGDAGHFRIFDSAGGATGTCIAQGSCGVSGSDMNFAGGVTFVAGGVVAISSFTVTVPVS
ncbi:MAG: hypothetical protein IT452_10445 [Planctomycetia bacterium]|nr:hypothetical protein [Planctomycetia bacterium]